MSNCFRYYRIFSKVIKREAKIKIKFLSVEYFDILLLVKLVVQHKEADAVLSCFVVKVPEKSPAGV